MRRAREARRIKTRSALVVLIASRQQKIADEGRGGRSVSAVLGEFRAAERGYGPDEIAADCALHIAAIAAAIGGSAALLHIAWHAGRPSIWPILVYCGS